MYLKRSKIPKSWPLKRKGTKYLINPENTGKKGVPLLLLLRDVLQIAKTRKELRYMLLNKEIKVNNKVRVSEGFAVQVFDVISIDKIKKNFKLEIVNKRFILKEVSNEESKEKVVKISGKKVLQDKLIQMNLEDGTNILSKDNFNVGDSAILNTLENKITKVLKLEKGATIEIISGKHAGEKGKLEEILGLSRGKKYRIKLKGGEVEVPGKVLLVIN